MSSYRIIGGRPLTGLVKTPGSKNALFPLMSAAVLFNAPVTIANVPEIRDATVMKDILRSLGAVVTEIDDTTIHVDPSIHSTDISPTLARKLRGSVVLLGSLLGRYGEVSLPIPGGDLIGPRPIDQHLKGLKQMGAEIHETASGYRVAGKLHGADIYLEKATVTGTENLILAAVLASGTTTIRHAAAEAHVGALVKFLIKAGVEIKGLGTHTLTITGRDGKVFDEPANVELPADDLDAGTMAIGALLTKGEVTIDPYPAEALRPFTEKLLEIGAGIEIDSNTGKARVLPGKTLDAFKILVGYAPGFPSDLQAPMAVLATQAEGSSLIHDWLYQGRFGYAEDLMRFGARIEIFDPHRIQVTGPSALHGTTISSPDIRAGMAYILAALTAEGESVINRTEIVERGYVQIPERLSLLGADIHRDEESA